jgi:hypothetical protein
MIIKNNTVMNLWGPTPWGIFYTDQLSNYHLKKNSAAWNCCMKCLLPIRMYKYCSSIVHPIVVLAA